MEPIFAVERALQEYIDVENDMIQRFKDMIARTEDPSIKLMLRYLIEDEKWHERLLGDGVKQVFKLDLS